MLIFFVLIMIVASYAFLDGGKRLLSGSVLTGAIIVATTGIIFVVGWLGLAKSVSIANARAIGVIIPTVTMVVVLAISFSQEREMVKEKLKK